MASSSIGFTITNWNKSGNIYCKLGKGDSLFVAYSGKGKVVFKSSWCWSVQNKVWLVLLLSLTLLLTFRELKVYSCAGNVIFFQKKNLSLACF